MPRFRCAFLEGEHVHARRSRERGCFLVVQILWAEKIQSTTDAGSLNTFGRNEIEVAPIFIGTSSHCVFSNSIQNVFRTKNSQPTSVQASSPCVSNATCSSFAMGALPLGFSPTLPPPRVSAGASGFLNFSQSFDRPER